MQTTQILRWIRARLLSDATIVSLIGDESRIQSEEAPEDVVFPYILISVVSPPLPNYTVAARAVTNDAVYLIRGIIRDDSYGNTIKNNQLETIANRILALFHNPGINLTYNIHSCVLDQEYVLTEPPRNDTQYRHLGGRFRISTQAP